MKKHSKRLFLVSGLVVCMGLTLFAVRVWGLWQINQARLQAEKAKSLESAQTLAELEEDLAKLTRDYETLASDDQLKINKDLKVEIEAIQKTYSGCVDAYEAILDLRAKTTKAGKIEEGLAKVLALLAKRDYLAASTALATVSGEIKKQEALLATSVTLPANLPQSNTAPGSGLSRQVVSVNGASFQVDIIAADLGSTKVVVDTASDQDCRNDCPVGSLASFVGRSGAFAGINGPYFCPASYPSCADKKNSFDTLLMNKHKTYFNSDNNVYSSVPAAIFSTSARFVAASSEWGRDTGVDSVIAGQPLLVLNGESRFGGDGDTKKSAKGNRSFIGATGNTVYIGVVHNASVAEVAQVLVTMGVKNAINLDSGGSTALWWGGKYIVGPGRETPFGILLVKR